MSVPDWVGRSERDALEALANATVLTVMIGQGPQADGHVPPCATPALGWASPISRLPGPFSTTPSPSSSVPNGSPPRCWTGTAGNRERTRGAAAAGHRQLISPQRLP